MSLIHHLEEENDMKRSLVVLALVAVMLVVTVAGAGAFPAGEWVSGVTVANLSATATGVWISFRNPDGSEALGFDGGTIQGNSAKTWYLPDVTALPDPFMGSAIVEAEQPIAAIVNTQFPTGSNPMRVGTSVGESAPAPNMYATQLMREYAGWNSYCAVQNTGADAVNVTAYYYNSAGTQVDTDTVSVPGTASFIFDQSTDTELTAGQQYSAKFVSDADHPLAVVCNFYNTGASASASQFHSYNGIAQGGDVLYVPRLVKDYYYYQSGLKVQNVGTEALTVQVAYSFGGSTYTQTSTSIGPGQSWGPYLGDSAQLPSSMATVSGSGSAVISVVSPNANKAIIATVNEDNRVDPAGRGVTYRAALPTDASATLIFPQVTSEYYGYSSGIQVAKVSAGTLSCQACYSAYGPVAAFCDSFQLTDAVPSWSQFAPNGSGMVAGMANDNYNGAVTVSCPGGTVIGIANLSFRYDRDNRYGNLTGDSFTTARGINN
jgi:hypothetical protein